MQIKLCYPDAMNWILSLTPAAAQDSLATIANPHPKAGLVELRLDLLPGLDIRAAIAACPLPVLVTNRSTAEGGQGSLDPAMRKMTITEARNAGAALIDVEFDRDLDLLPGLGIPQEQLVISWHDTEGTPDDLEERCEAMLKHSCFFAKAITTATSVHDLGRVLAVSKRLNPKKRAKRRLVCFAMGSVGIPSRLLSPLFGPQTGFAAWNRNAAAAPGQLAIDDLEAISGHLTGPPSKLFAVVGSNVSASLSPRMHGAAYRALDLPYLMVPLSVPDPDELDTVFAHQTIFDEIDLPLSGLAVTTPYKRQAHDAASLRSPRCERAQAANTLVFGQDSIRADNTDADGIVSVLKDRGISIAGMSAIVQGTGGAARGAAIGLDLAGAEVSIRGREAKHSAEIATELGINHLAPDETDEDAKILVNATPLGRSNEDQIPFTGDEIDRAAAIVDMVYADTSTPLIKEAEARRIVWCDGRDVLAHQGFAQFAAFTAQLPPKDAMIEAIRS